MTRATEESADARTPAQRLRRRNALEVVPPPLAAVRAARRGVGQELHGLQSGGAGEGVRRGARQRRRGRRNFSRARRTSPAGTAAAAWPWPCESAECATRDIAAEKLRCYGGAHAVCARFLRGRSTFAARAQNVRAAPYFLLCSSGSLPAPELCVSSPAKALRTRCSPRGSFLPICREVRSQVADLCPFSCTTWNASRRPRRHLRRAGRCIP